jgi:hypothetical protein
MVDHIGRSGSRLRAPARAQQGGTLGELSMRRLPVLQATSEAGEERPAWQWTIAGALLVLSIWAPLAMLGNLVVGRTMRSWVGGESPEDVARLLAAGPSAERVRAGVLLVGVHGLLLLAAALAGGAMVGRFGGHAGAREAALSGLLVAVTGWALSGLQGGPFPSFSMLAGLMLLAGGGAWMGGKMGVRRRKVLATRPAPPPPPRTS